VSSILVPSVIAIIQARMTSTRYPGKMLAPFLGKPLLAHVVKRLRASYASPPVILATSDEAADDPLALYGQSLGIPVVRGPRDDVVGRFVLALQAHPCEAFFRVCGDSPLLLPHLFNAAVSLYQNGMIDVVTNIFPRTFPVGMSVELVRSATFLAAAEGIVDANDREHVTRFFYNNPEQFKICNIQCDGPYDPDLKLAVDELGDMQRLTAWLADAGNEYWRLFPVGERTRSDIRRPTSDLGLRTSDLGPRSLPTSITYDKPE